MAGYGYVNRGYVPYSGVGPRTDEWSKTSYAGNGYSSDHVCRPVIIDAEGRKRPIVSYNPSHSTESYAATTETIVERVQSPMVTEYKYSSPARVEYGVVTDKWRRPSSPVHDRPEIVEEFITKVQTEVSRPRFGPLNAAHWRQTPNATGNHGNSGYGYGDYSDYDKEWQRPASGNTIRNDNYDYYRKNDSAMEPTMITAGGWARPSNSTWAAPPNHEGQLGKPTNDIGAAMEYLKEAAKPSPSRFTAPTVGKRDGYIDTIDSREAARRYGNFKLPSRAYTTGENYATTIDSREAARKYNGSTVFK